MTNAPENYEAFVLPEGVEKIEYEEDTKLENSGVFKIEREDHTIGNLIRMQLLRDPDVIFVGYRHPHPIEHHILLRVQTSSKSKNGTPYTPQAAFKLALADLSSEVNSITEQLKAQI